MQISLVERVGVWISSRKAKSEQVELSQHNTYIFPTSYGFGFICLLLIQLVAAINYQNSLIYLATFFLGSVFLVSIWACYLNVGGLVFYAVHSEGSFEGDSCSFKIGIKSHNKPVIGLRVGTAIDDMCDVSLDAGEVKIHEILLSGKKRGVHSVPRVRIESTFPFGFIRAWAWINLDAQYLVYPRREFGDEASAAAATNEQGVNQFKGEDRDILREHIQGEPLNRVNWKKYAVTNKMYSADSDANAGASNKVDWRDYEGKAKEERLRFMCFKVCRLYHEGQSFGFALPSAELSAANGKDHFEQCLELLARY